MTRLRELAQTSPHLVLASAVPFRVRYTLPEEVLSFLEERVDAVGDVGVGMATPLPGQHVDPGPFHVALIGNRQFDVIFTGPGRSGNVPQGFLHGVALGKTLVLSDSPLRMVEAGEKVGVDKPVVNQCPISGDVTPEPPPPSSNVAPTDLADAGDKFIHVCTPPHLPELEQQLITDERKRHPMAFGSEGTDGFIDSSQPSIAWTTGVKKALVIRVDFSDLAGSNLSESDAVDIFNGPDGVNEFFIKNSFGKTSIPLAPLVNGDSADVTNVLRMPRTASYYATNNAYMDLHNDARAAATTAGFTISNFNRVCVYFNSVNGISGNQFHFSGMAFVVSDYVWINGSHSTRTWAHELGHTWGLQHASAVVTMGSDPTGSGDWWEYGDSFDVMGSGGTAAGHFNMWSKMRLHWLEDDGAKLITTAGTYRMGRFDHQNADPNNTALPLALRIARDNNREWWLGHRRADTNNPNAMNGMYAVWASVGSANTQLIDFNNPSGGDAYDAPLAIGSSFDDAGIVMSPVARGGTGAGEYLDVNISFTPRLSVDETGPTADEAAGTHRIMVRRLFSGTGAATAAWSTTAGSAAAGCGPRAGRPPTPSRDVRRPAPSDPPRPGRPPGCRARGTPGAVRGS